MIRKSVLTFLRRHLGSRSRYFSFKRSMASDHLGKTAENTRHEVISLATIVGIRDETKSIKFLTLKIQDDQLSFKAGQWVDMFIPGVDTVGGFSMCSSPLKLQRERTMDLAIKFSTHPPAHWVHTQCKEGDKVKVRVGGDFYFDPASNNDTDLLLIAGGVGINPLYSIINEVVDMNKGNNSDDKKFSGKVSLLYSAQTKEELLFKDELCEISKNNDNIMCQYHITREGDMFTKIGNVFTIGGRIGRGILPACFEWIRKPKTLVYICGPSLMIEDMEKVLRNLNIEESNIRYEKWW